MAGTLALRMAVIAGVAGLAACASVPAPLYAPVPGLFDPLAPDLGLVRAAGAETFTVFAPREETDQFSNGAVIAVFRGRLYVQWQSSAKDEDSEDTWVAHAVSADGGKTWSAPLVLAGPRQGEPMSTSGGWATDGEALVAFVNVWPGGFRGRTGGVTAYRLTTDGERWSTPLPVTGADGLPVNGVIEQDPHLYDGRLHTAFHIRPGIRARPFHTDDPLGRSGWRMGQMESLEADPPMSRELEPSLFRRPDGCLVMVMRDQASTFRQLAAESCDRGETWSRPAPTPMPDARTKQSAGNLPDGTAFLVHSPSGTRERLPLAVSFSADGRVFDLSLVLRGARDLQPQRFEGLYKRPGYHYPKSLVHDGWLYVAYTANKEDVQVTRVPLGALPRHVGQVVVPPRISRNSHALARRHSRLTAVGPLPIAAAVSSMESPRKNRSSTIRACSASWTSSRSSTWSRASTSDTAGSPAGGKAASSRSCRGTRIARPPRLTARRDRARSTRIRRIIREAIA